MSTHRRALPYRNPVVCHESHSESIDSDRDGLLRPARPECDAGDIMLAPLSVKYRHESPTIKGSSLSGLELLVADYRKCDGGIFRLSHNPLWQARLHTCADATAIGRTQVLLSSTQSAESGIEIS